LQSIEWLIPQLSNAQWLAHGIIFVINIGLLVFAKPILNLVEADRDIKTKVKIFQALNILVLVLHSIDLALLRVSANYENYFINVGLTLLTMYAGLFIYSLSCYFSRKRFGTEKLLDNNKVFIDTYSSRLVDLLLLVVITVTVIYALIKFWGADSMLETTGIFGIFVAFLAFTSNIWAPDIISGLIILNTQMLEDGDVVVIDQHPDEYIISKVTLIYVILYDVRNNHRTLIRNSQFTQSKIDNLSRVASTDGVRQALTYKIGYPTFDGESEEDRSNQLNSFKNRIERMFNLAFENCCNNGDVKINENRPFNWALTSTGDFALEYTLWIFLERIPNTKITSTIRKHLMGTIYKVNEAVYSASVIEKVDLSTPALNQVTLNSTS
jgi:Mechanosensitive ion channel, beta-domain